METVQFKTNIKCSGCIATVTPVLNEVAGQDNWEVDLQSPDKVLTVSTDKAGKEEIQQAIAKVGYKAEALA
ncbi:heavy-metal-associated domain-containing protein [Chitinophaga filiformis]|uniref:heavy-metal-associated domain-containing protein n=1 Tax=Chitinophaga filiformis TaxID=104663 RepID=UPI001F20774B|nr:heavy-metal-associated domain-containing protein [Chitinophaga filiformis]MCF6404840.1 heavy-metal-associated domain-containing protein [Chitinophaga filiformis]